MKWTVVLLIVVGLAAALCAAVLTAGLRAGWNNQASVNAEAPTEVEILVATRALPAMKVVDANDVARRTVKSNEVPMGASMSLANVIGKVLVAPVVEGQTFTDRAFASSESGLNLASALPKGYRAMSCALSTESGIEDLLYPGCVVDVVASFRLPTMPGRPSGEILSATLLQGVQVLAIGPRTIVNTSDNSSTDPSVDPGIDRKRLRMVTLMVDSKQAEALQLASTNGELTVTMRNPLDKDEQEGHGVMLSDISEQIAARLSAIDHVAAAAPMFAPEYDDEGAGQHVEMPAPASAPQEQPAPQAKAYWTTTVLRAGRSETHTFAAN